MKLLCVIDNLNSGGAQRQLVSIALYFKQQGDDTEFLVYNDSDFYTETLTCAGIPVHRVSGNLFQRISRMRKIIRNNRYDVVMAFLETPAFIATLSGFPFRKWKLIVGERSSNPEILKNAKLVFYRLFHVFADYVISNSFTNREMVRKINPFIPRRKNLVIYNMIDFPRIDAVRADYQARRDGKVHIIVAARYQYLKNFRLLIEAVHSLDSQTQNRLQVDWYGDSVTPPYYDNSLPEARELIDRYGLGDRIFIHKATHDIIRKIKQADVVGLFSSYEGLSNVICEGMACSKAIIATDVSDNARLVTDGYNGFLCGVNADSISEVLNKTVALSSDELKNMGSNSRARAMELFNDESTIRKYYELCTRPTNE